ncbi:MAG: HupE/UreJ family protein, partial [Anaerolineae bacterium]|nr:HupE/UreJ family protein [Anaerolineae bacterium]
MRRALYAIAVVALLAHLLVAARPAGAHDMPEEVVIQTFVKPSEEKLDVLLRIPLVLFLNLDLPKRGPGYLDLAGIEPHLERAAVAVSKEIVFFEEDRLLVPAVRASRLAIPADTSFERYETALAHLQGEPLPATADLFWNQGFFDVHLQYPIVSPQSDFALQLRMAPEVQKRAHLIIRFLSPAGPIRAYDVAGSSEPIHLDPRWHQAAWTFTKTGFVHVLDGIDHLLFLLCLVIPFRHGRLRPLVAIVTSFTIAHSITLIGAAYNLTPSGQWFLPLVETLIAASIVYMALENIVAGTAPAAEAGGTLQRRWLITGAFGLVHGVGFSAGLQQSFQLAGDHLLLSLLSFNVGVELAQMVALVAAVVTLRVVARHVAQERVLALLLSALLAHTGWHWMLERGQQLQFVAWPALDAALVTTLARLLLVLLLAAGAVRLLMKGRERLPTIGKLRT